MSQLIGYVDGFNLYHGLHQKWGRQYLWLDLVTLIRSLRPRDHLVAVKYFTASVLDDAPAQARQDTYINALTASHPGLLSVVYGRYQRKLMSCRACGASWRSYEEKETDVNISTAIVADAASQAMTSTLLISADGDLAPAIRTARSINPELFATAAFSTPAIVHDIAHHHACVVHDWGGPHQGRSAPRRRHHRRCLLQAPGQVEMRASGTMLEQRNKNGPPKRAVGVTLART